MSFFKKILVVTDNFYLYNQFGLIIDKLNIANNLFSFARTDQRKLNGFSEEFPVINMKVPSDIIDKYDLVISLHCKQLFPEELVSAIKCINIHPGLNPYNRGWYPQVFSILNGLPLGATIHEVDNLIDHGAIIAQKEVELYAWDTSLTAYNRVLSAELELIEKWIISIINNEYTPAHSSEEGNVNLKKDFDLLCKMNLSETGSFQSFLDRLRALSHGEYHNAYFLDKSGKKIYVKIQLEPDK